MNTNKAATDSKTPGSHEAARLHPLMWSTWRDFSCGTHKSWRMRTPIGVLSFRTKKLAYFAKDEYLRIQARDAK